MGCFSWMCKECGKAVLSTSFEGQRVKLFLLKDGKVIQEMEGDYDSYGRVFIDDTQDPSVQHSLRESVQWKEPFSEYQHHDETNDPLLKRMQENQDKHDVAEGRRREAWSKVCDLMFSKSPANGIAAIHSKCFTGEIPTTESEDDPNQGWGSEDELLGATELPEGYE